MYELKVTVVRPRGPVFYGSSFILLMGLHRTKVAPLFGTGA